MLTIYVKLKIQSSTIRRNVNNSNLNLHKVNKSKIYSKFENFTRKVLTNSKSYMKKEN